MNKISSALEKVINKKNFESLVQSNFLEFSIKEKIAIPKEVLLHLTKDYLDNHEYNADSKGLIRARASISNYYKDEGIAVNINNIIVTASTSESYSQIFMNFTKPGQEVLFPNPSYPLFEYLSEYANIIPKFYKLNESNNWEIDINQLENSITKKTAGIVLISPNNPTGSIISRHELQQIQSIAAKHHLFIIFDEVFSEFRSNKDFPRPIANNNTDVFLLNGISKMLALPDFKLAWIAVPGYKKDEIIDKLETSNDTFLNANYLTQSMLPKLLLYKKIISENINSVLNYNKEQLNTFICKYPDKFGGTIGNGGIHNVLKVRTKSNDETLVIKLLTDKGLYVHPGYFYDIEPVDGYSHIIISILKSKNSFKKTLKLLAGI